MNDEKSILITGASSGIGEALALRYAAPGAFLALSGRNEERLLRVAERCRAKGADVDTAVLDVTDRGGMEDWIVETDSLRPLDLVIANAGISGGPGRAMGGESLSQARAIFDVNLTGVLNTLEPILPRLIKRRGGQVAIIASVAGYRGFPSAPAYSASKAAVRCYGEALRGNLKDTGVKINVVCPGFVRSRLTDTNDFPMPFIMDADRAAATIASGLALNRGRIAFPLPTALATWFMSVLPDAAAQKILTRLPPKKVNSPS